jgi:acyl-CoA thioesterase-1
MGLRRLIFKMSISDVAIERQEVGMRLVDRTIMTGAKLALLAAMLGFCLFAASPSQAAARVNIVAIGGSNTAGRGVGPAFAWPVRLEEMLRSKGYDVSITNAGVVSGQTSSEILSRLDTTVPEGTKLVILHTSTMDSANKAISPEQRHADVEAIRASLSARHVKLIFIPDIYAGIPYRERQRDNVHLTAIGHEAVARRLLPSVVRAIGG